MQLVQVFLFVTLCRYCGVFFFWCHKLVQMLCVYVSVSLDLEDPTPKPLLPRVNSVFSYFLFLGDSNSQPFGCNGCSCYWSNLSYHLCRVFTSSYINGNPRTLLLLEEVCSFSAKVHFHNSSNCNEILSSLRLCLEMPPSIVNIIYQFIAN